MKDPAHKMVTLRVSESEYARWQRVAEAVGLPLSTWIRSTCRHQAARDADRVQMLERRTAALEAR